MPKLKTKAVEANRPSKMEKVPKEKADDKSRYALLDAYLPDANIDDYDYSAYQPAAEDLGGDDGEDFAKEESHSKLIDSLDNLVKTKKKFSRKEEMDTPFTKLSGVTLTSLMVAGNQNTETEGEGLTMSKILASIKNKDLRKKAAASIVTPSKKKGKKEKPLSLTTSLEKPVVKRIERAILYDHVKKDVSKWNAMVYHNRLADNLVFPLQAEKVKSKPEEDYVPYTPLEIECAKILHGPEYVERKRKEVFGKPEEESESVNYVKSIEEALEKHAELSRLRALQSYEMAKAKRRNKIKSKKYHRLLRRDKIRKQLKEFEELQEKDPAAAMLKLEEFDKARVQERMSLKHRNTSKWAKMQAARAKYNRDSRVALSEQLKISRDLTTKVAESSDDDEDDEDLDIPDLVKSSMNNPWFMNNSTAEAEQEKMSLYYTGYKKLWDEINARKERDAKREEADAERKRAENKTESAEATVTDADPPKKPKKKKNVLKKLKQKAEKLKKAEDAKREVAVKAALEDKSDESEAEQSAIELDSDSDGELTMDQLNNLLSRAHDKVVKKASSQLKELRSQSSEPVPEVKANSQQKKRKAGDTGPKPKRNRDGDIDEIRDLTVDEEAINFEGGDPDEDAPIDLISVRQREGASLMRKIDPEASEKSTKRPPVNLINVSDYLKIGKGSKFNMSEVNDEEAEGDEDSGQLQNIAEAFEDDDVVAEFQAQKAEVVEAGKPKDVDLSLPGWGEWGGKDLKPSRKKQSRFILKAPPAAPRKDAKLSHVILNENGNEKLKAHQVRQLPFPYSRVKDFEKMVRAPVGKTWLPEKAVKSLITPKVITRLGAVIQPISEDELVNKLSMTKDLKLAGVRRSDRR